MKQILYITLLLSFCSCDRVDGKIETRNKSKAYVVNGSTTKTYRFTVKTTSIKNDSIYNYQTKIVELAPGDELFLGNRNEVSEIEYPYIRVTNFKTYPKASKDNISLAKGAVLLNENDEPVSQKRKSKKKTEDDFKTAFLKSVLSHNEGKDTVINGEQLMYVYETILVKDTANPFPRKHYKYKYEVTGQVEVKHKAANSKEQ